jgi:hypothetical protein
MNLTFHEPDISWTWHLIYQTSHIPNISYIEHVVYRTSWISNISYTQHLIYLTSHILDISYTWHLTYLTSHRTTCHILITRENVSYPCAKNSWFSKWLDQFSSYDNVRRNFGMFEAWKIQSSRSWAESKMYSWPFTGRKKGACQANINCACFCLSWTLKRILLLD